MATHEMITEYTWDDHGVSGAGSSGRGKQDRAEHLEQNKPIYDQYVITTYVFTLLNSSK